MKLPNATLSICVDAEEGERVRNAAALAHMTVSAWCSARVAGALVSSSHRAWAKQALADMPPAMRGSRKGRISCVMRQNDHDQLKAVASAFRTGVHTLAQAIILRTASDEVEGRTAAQIKAARALKEADAPARTFQAAVVKGTAVDITAVSATVRQLLGVMPAQIMDGNGPKIAEGVTRTAARIHGGEVDLVKLEIPEFELRAVAHVLGVQPTALAAAFAFKATKA